MSAYTFSQPHGNTNKVTPMNSYKNGVQQCVGQVQQTINHRPNTQPRYQQQQQAVDNDCLNNRNNNQADMLASSIQSTRPTSKTALLIKQRRSMLDQLRCFLCQGYLIDATTVGECMDSFCKSCIVRHLQRYSNCPKCDIVIHKTNPLSSLRSDKVLQDIVYKLVPGLYDNEMRRRREFYRIPSVSSSDDDDDEGSSDSLGKSSHNTVSGEHYGVISHPKPFYKLTDNINLSIEPYSKNDCSTIYYDNKRQSIVTSFTGNQQQLTQQQLGARGFSSVDKLQFKTYLRCPARLTVMQLKKFVAAKFNICRNDVTQLLYLNENISGDLSLIDIAYIYDWRGTEPMRLFYIIERELANEAGVEELSSKNSRGTRGMKTHQTVGTSTQTVKRVCIDPNPKFYDEQRNDQSTQQVVTVIGGRTMRPRIESNTSANRDVGGITNKIQPTSVSVKACNIRESSSRGNSIHQNHQSNGTLTNRVDSSASSRELRKQSSFNNSVTGAIDESSRLGQNKSMDTRATRKSTSARSSPPKISINLSHLNQKKASDLVDKNMNTYSRVDPDKNYQLQNRTQVTVAESRDNSSINNSVKQLIPYIGSSTGVASTSLGLSQSTMVTLASFTEARNNHVMAVSASSASSITSSYKNLMNAESHSKLGTKSLPEPKNINGMTNSAPQVAFSFVTERGITIRLPNQRHDSNSYSYPNVIKSNSLPALPAPPGSHYNSESATINNRLNSHNSDSQSRYNDQPNAGTSRDGGMQQANNIHSANNSRTDLQSGGGGNRHLVKVKPVYKTFVDVTKLKSPNFKKLGYTARHQPNNNKFDRL